MYGIASDPSFFYLVEILESEERVVKESEIIFDLQEGRNSIKLCIRQKVCHHGYMHVVTNHCTMEWKGRGHKGVSTSNE